MNYNSQFLPLSQEVVSSKITELVIPLDIVRQYFSIFFKIVAGVQVLALFCTLELGRHCNMSQSIALKCLVVTRIDVFLTVKFA
jgi:hypothetical protein